MPINFNVDKKKKQISIIQNGEIITTLSQEEGIQFFDNLKEVQQNYGYLFVNFKHKITLDSLQENEKRRRENYGDDSIRIVGVNFYGENMLRLNHTNFYAEFILENDPYIRDMSVDVEVKNNFSEGYLWEGSVSNFDLRNCLDEALIEHFKNNPDMFISFAGANITTEVLFDDEEDRCYFNESYDT